MKRAILITITMLMLMSGMFGIMNASTASENTVGISSAPGNNVPLTSHVPIRINSNADFTSANGVVSGSGTQADPYIIENYDINGTNAGSCLYIGNTTAYFIVRNCSLHDASGNSGTYYRNSGLYLYNVEGGILDNNTASNNNYGIYLSSSSNNTITNNNASSNNGGGIYLYSSNSNTIANNTASNNDYGIYFDSSGICLSSSSNNTITNNNASSNNGGGIYLYSSNSNTIANNTASNNGGSIYLYYSSSNTIANNTASNNRHGISLYYSSHTDVLTGNTMINDGISIYSSSLNSWNTHTIDITNTVNGKPVYYWKNLTSGTVPAGAGEVILANCTGVTVENQNVSDGSVGILMGFSSGNTITNNTASANSQYGMYIYSSSNNTVANNTASNDNNGVYLDSSSNNTIANNTASSNNNYGIQLDYSNSNTITNNNASNNNYGTYLNSSYSNTITNNTANWNNHNGIYLYWSSSSTITNNTASNNYDGIWLESSSSNTITNNTASNNYNGIYLGSSSNSNTIYHNNFINNTNQAYDDTGANRWNASYPEGGNYWSDYNGADNYSGSAQDLPGPDGIGDTPNTNVSDASGAQDYYPLMHPTWYPSIEIISPSEEGILNVSTVTVSWEGSADSGINHYEIQIDGGNWTNVGLNTSYTFTGLSDDSYTVEVKVIDNASNENTASVIFTVDTTPPEITIDSPSDGTIFNTTTVTVSWTGSDAASGIDHYEIRMDSGNWTNVGLKTSYNFTGLSDGSHTVDVKAVDNASNDNTASVTFTVDTTAPEVIIDSPSDGAILNTAYVTVSWAGSDATSGIYHYEIRINSGNWIDVGTDTSHTFTELSDGSHTVDVKAVDNASNENTASVTFTVDARAPEVTINAPSDGTIFNTTDVTVSWNGSDATSGIDHYEIRIDSGNWENVGLNTSYNFTGLSDGSHTVDVKAVDNASNENTASVTFTLDATTPTVVSHSPMGNNVSIDSVITVTFSEEMDHSTVHIEINGINVSITWNNNTATFTPSQNISYDTNYTVNITGSDLAGNLMDEYAWSFSTEKVPSTTETGTITGTVTDTNGNPVAGATVTLDSGETATTDENGHFEIQAHAGDHTLTISKDGYETETFSTSLNSGEVKELQIPLLAASQEEQNNSLLWLWLLLIIIVLAAIGVLVAKRKKVSGVPDETEENAEASAGETEETEESLSSTEEIPPPPEEDVEAETPVEGTETPEEIGKEEI